MLTLPIAVGRMIALTGTPMSDVFFCISGSLLASCGWIDALLYTLTRRILTSQEMSAAQYSRTPNTLAVVGTNAARPGDDDDDHFGLQTMSSKTPINATARTVTIVGGKDRVSHVIEHKTGHTRGHFDEGGLGEDVPSRTGSQDSMYKPSPPGNGINIKTETQICVETTDHGFESETPRSRD